LIREFSTLIAETVVAAPIQKLCPANFDASTPTFCKTPRRCFARSSLVRGSPLESWKKGPGASPLRLDKQPRQPQGIGHWPDKTLSTGVVQMHKTIGLWGLRCTAIVGPVLRYPHHLGGTVRNAGHSRGTRVGLASYLGVGRRKQIHPVT